MPSIKILGASNAVPSLHNDNTHMIVLGETRVVLIDSPGSPMRRISEGGIDPNTITDLILTHFHPDHVSGVPLLLMDLWLLGRKQPLHIYGLEHTIDRTEKLMDLFEWQNWPGFFSVEFHRLPEEEYVTIIDVQEMRIQSSPMKHFIPIIGLRIEFKELGKIVTYSCDTEPCPQDIRLAAGADVLIHESTGAFAGHSSAEQAGEVAQAAKVKKLYLIHYPTWGENGNNPVAEAGKQFSGPVVVATDFMDIEFITAE